MSGVSPRSVMNRLSARATMPDLVCLSPLNALDSIWQGRTESVSLTEDESAKYIEYVSAAVQDYEERAVHDVQKAYGERFEETAAELLADYLAEVATVVAGGARGQISREGERSMREMERQIGISERDKDIFRSEIHDFFEDLTARYVPFDYTTELRLRAAIERRLFPDRKTLRNELDQPRSSSGLAEWRRRRGSMQQRLIGLYGYCSVCADDLVKYVAFLLRGNDPFRIIRNDIEWLWRLNPLATPAPGTGDVGRNGPN
jgi:serine protein kinase